MFRKISFIVLFASFISVLTFAETPEEQGLRIAKEIDQANNGFLGEKSTLEMVLINAHGDKVERKMDSKVKETKTDGDKSIVTFHWPADVKGTRMLTWTHKEGDDDQWLYLPSLKRVKRISSRNKSGSFMGSEFSYEDLSSYEFEKYEWKLLREDQIEGRSVWVLEAIPKDPRSGYSKQVQWMDKEYMNPLRIEYYDRKGEKLKTSTFSGYKKYGNLWRQSKIEMVNHQTGKQSVLTWQDRALQIQHSDGTFESQNLEG